MIKGLAENFHKYMIRSRIADADRNAFSFASIMPVGRTTSAASKIKVGSICEYKCPERFSKVLHD
jgi:hypothetical protein